MIDEELPFDPDEDEGTLKNIDLLALDGSTADEVTSLVTDDEDTLVNQSNAIDHSLVAADEMASALMLYNDGFPSGQETILDSGEHIFVDILF